MSVYYYFITFDTSMRDEIKKKKLGKAEMEQIRLFPQKVYDVLRGRTWKGYRFINVRDIREIPKGAQWFEIRLCPRSKIRYYCMSIKGNLSCAMLNGHNIYINLDRWLYGSDIKEIPLGEYQIYVINHEVGHILGRGHPQHGFTCSSGGQKSPVMQQQTLRLNGCKFNPYPLDKE